MCILYVLFSQNAVDKLLPKVVYQIMTRHIKPRGIVGLKRKKKKPLYLSVSFASVPLSYSIYPNSKMHLNSLNFWYVLKTTCQHILLTTFIMDGNRTGKD